ncbi:DUF2288 domain-containing protein [Betaproteobacteria bacterium SCN1]|nr:DUF2288 domain-containing protein [Betaproteobacteria bacterium SCN1]MBN8760294.1 DUF2288 domain-containing protein [Thiobacillus sp.]ODU90028.1 MAG: hypothetical protein ABT21_04925 [Thiobacillus sp. SCN 65-179]OJW39650.1 MAG: hypothetical protein BGO61_12075 [Thiobacillus sp. 65-69]
MTPSDILRAKLNLETARLAWPELERHFARGVVVRVKPGFDLVDAALQVAENNTEAVQAWLADGTLVRPDMDDAQRWHAAQQVFWGVVVAPWVLVQEASDTDMQDEKKPA